MTDALIASVAVLWILVVLLSLVVLADRDGVVQAQGTDPRAH